MGVRGDRKQQRRGVDRAARDDETLRAHLDSAIVVANPSGRDAATVGSVSNRVTSALVNSRTFFDAALSAGRTAATSASPLASTMQANESQV